LVVHQGEEGIGDEGGPREEEGRELEADGLAEARRKEDHLPQSLGPLGRSVQDVGRYEPLVGVEIIEAESLPRCRDYGIGTVLHIPVTRAASLGA
jgi:hypothetical protein